MQGFSAILRCVLWMAQESAGFFAREIFLAWMIRWVEKKAHENSAVAMA
jgi:hypothetical protein